MFRPRAYLIVILLFCSLSAASAQERVWNAALDWYEHVCSKCAGWKDRIDAGESVPKDSLQAMMKELAAVRQNLQGAWGEMTPGQRLRFEVIRDRFASGRWHRPGVAPLALVPELDQLAVTPGYDSYSLADYTLVPTHKRPFFQRVRIAPVAGLTASVYPDYSAGLVAGATAGRWGLFLKGRSNFHSRKTSYECLSDGTTAGGYFWGGGEKTVNRHQLTLDLSYNVIPWLSVYTGAGFCVRTLCWKDYAGAWALVSDRSYRGVSMDAGILVSPFIGSPVNGLSLLLGCSRVQGGYFDFELGLCWLL